MEQNYIQEDQELEIDLKALLLKVKSLWYVVVIGILVGSILAVCYSVFLKTPMYEASSQVYLRGSSNNVSLQELQLSSALAKDYEIIFTSRPNMEKVIKELDLDYSAGQLRSMITITNPADTHILKVSVTSTDPTLSRDIANEVVNQATDNIREIDSQEPYLIEKAIANENPVGSSTTKMTILGALAGMVVALGVIGLKFILNDNVQSVEDVEKTIGVPVLTVVLEDSNLKYVKKNVDSKRRGSVR